MGSLGGGLACPVLGESSSVPTVFATSGWISRSEARRQSFGTLGYLPRPATGFGKDFECDLQCGATVARWCESTVCRRRYEYHYQGRTQPEDASAICLRQGGL